MLNAAIVGFGFMGMTHTSNILKNPNIRLKAIIDINPDNIHDRLNLKMGNFSTETVDANFLSQVKVYSNLTDCLQKESVDLCVIAVHTNLHYEVAKTALEAGTHVFVEKPFCLDPEQGKELIELARKKNKILMVGQVLRFMPAYQTLKKWIDTGELGKLEFLSLSRFSGLPLWGQWLDRQTDFGSSGGALFDLVIHDIDFAQWVCGSPDTINAKCLPGRLSNHDYVTAHWEYKNSPLHIKIEGGNTFHSNFPFQASFSGRFEHASVHYSSHAPGNIVVAVDSGTSLVPAGDANEGFSGELNYFVNCIADNIHPENCTPESALETIKTCYRHIS